MSIIGSVISWAEDPTNGNSTVLFTEGRYYPVALPDKPNYPAVTVNQIDRPVGETDHDGVIVYDTARMQFDVYARTLQEAGEVSNRLNGSFHGLHQKQIGSGIPDGGIFVNSAFRENEGVTKDQELDRWRITLDFLLNFKET